MSTKAQEEKRKAGEKKFITAEPLPALLNMPPQ
jgi:hypothetical protein